MLRVEGEEHGGLWSTTEGFLVEGVSELARLGVPSRKCSDRENSWNESFLSVPDLLSLISKSRMKESPILGGVLRTGLDLAGSSAGHQRVKSRAVEYAQGSLGQALLLGEEDFLQAGSASWRLVGEGKANLQVVEMEHLRDKQP